jgi:WD40 repeat protein
MADGKVTKSEKSYIVTDGEKRGPLTMSRVKFHPSGRHVLAACADRRLAFWDLAGEPVKEKNREGVPGKLVCPHELGWVRGFDVHPSGETIVTGGSDRRLRLWKWDGNGPAESPASDVAAHDGWVEGVAFSLDAARIASVGADRQLKLWDVDRLAPIKAVPAHSGIPRDLAFSRDGKWIVTGGEDGVAIVWNATTLEEVRRIDTGQTSDQQGQHPSLGGIIRLALSHDDRWLVLACARLSHVYELATGMAIGEFKQFGADVAAGNKSPLLAVGSSNNMTLQTYDPSQFKPQSAEWKKNSNGKPSPPTLPPFPGREIAPIKRSDFACGVAFSSDDRRLATGSANGSVEVWNVG